MRRLKGFDWEAAAGIAAAVVALVLHLLHIAETEVILFVILVLLALLLLRDLRRENRDEDKAGALAGLRDAVGRLEAAVQPPDTLLVGPRRLRDESERFARQASGQMLWFNVCLVMFEPQELFDVLLRPALENARVVSVQFVLDPREEERWRATVLPKAEACGGLPKLREPRWVALEENVSFILADNANGETEAHVSFWGEPFMARDQGREMPRYIFRVLPGSELIGRLVEMERLYSGRSRRSPVADSE